MGMAEVSLWPNGGKRLRYNLLTQLFNIFMYRKFEHEVLTRTLERCKIPKERIGTLILSNIMKLLPARLRLYGKQTFQSALRAIPSTTQQQAHRAIYRILYYLPKLVYELKHN